MDYGGQFRMSTNPDLFQYPADLLTRYPRKAGADLLNGYKNISRPHQRNEE